MPALIPVLILVLSLLPPFAIQQQETDSRGWTKATPEAYGFDSALLEDALRSIAEEVPGAHSLTLVREGALLVDAAFFPYDGSTPHDMASVTKSVTVTLIGIAIDQGLLSLDDTMLSFFPERQIANRDERKERITVGDLASMRTGMACTWHPGEPQLQEMLNSDDWLQTALDLPMATDPGAIWDYCSPATHILSAILQHATGMTALDYAQEHLFAPLGVSEVIWQADSEGYTFGWGDLVLYPHDAAKLGQLWLDGGQWDGHQVVPAQWVNAMMTPLVQTSDPAQSYSYGMWIMNESNVGGEIKASGRGGQYIAIFPEIELVVVITGGGGFDAGDVLDHVARGLVDLEHPLPDSPDGVRALEDAIAGLRTPPPPRSASPLPPVADEISGRIYTLGENPLGIGRLRLDVSSDSEAVVALFPSDGSPPASATIGLDGAWRLSPGEHGFPMAARGEWADETTFVFQLEFVANIDSHVVELHFYDDRVDAKLVERTWDIEAETEGTAEDP